MDLMEVHKHSIYNEEEVKKSSVCGCFYCGKIFSPTEIDSFQEEVNGKKTAFCPYCGIDSIIGSESGYEITSEFLAKMNENFF